MGRERDELDVPAEVLTVGALRAWLIARGAPWDTAFGDTRRRVRAFTGLSPQGWRTLCALAQS